MPKPSTGHIYRFEAIGTTWAIDTAGSLAEPVRRQVDTLIDTFTREYSRFEADSLVSRLARTGGSATFTSGASAIFGLYDSLFAATDGRVTPLIGSVLEDLGYDAAYSLKSKPTSAPLNYDTIVSHEGNTVTLTQPALLDIGAVGKGYLVDQIAAIVGCETSDFVVDGSGDVVVGDITERIGLEDPRDPSRVIGHVDLRNASLCGSASNRRAWGEELHHIVDPMTQKPVQSILATWVIAPTTLLADGLATALFFTAPEKLQKSHDFAYVILYADGAVSYTHHDRITLYD